MLFVPFLVDVCLSSLIRSVLPHEVVLRAAILLNSLRRRVSTSLLVYDVRPTEPLFAVCVVRLMIATWLILPVVICLSQRLSHACLSTRLNTAKLRMAH